MQTALFAGHRMIAITGNNDFRLCYLDCESEEFSSLEEAKESTTGFAVAVLEYIIQFIERERRHRDDQEL